MLADRQRDTQRDWPQYAARLPEPIFIQCLHRKQKTALFSGVRGGGATTEFFVHWQNDQQSGGVIQCSHNGQSAWHSWCHLEPHVDVDTAATHVARLPTDTVAPPHCRGRQHHSKSSLCPWWVRASGVEAGQCGRHDDASNQCDRPAGTSITQQGGRTGQLCLTLHATGSSALTLNHSQKNTPTQYPRQLTHTSASIHYILFQLSTPILWYYRAVSKVQNRN